ncbi:MAG: magnesium/cobalt transporter CorA [Verrucomicrobia bacterium]|nr:magnesium/cobalt transporter CorA [Kiritimatiellia bacterium]MCB1101669.1 magnesium/cobalt transporter CorA [Kiritimatiellia bacterium]MCP5488090.1 magnesium/cobalt transporter CorA [Verrucomicrobiota bacterium]
MIRSFVFSQGKLVGENLGLDFIKTMLFDDDAQIWVDLENPTDAEATNLLDQIFNFHPLAIEDCLLVSEQPKIDEYDRYLFMILHAPNFEIKERQFSPVELDLFIGKNFLVSFHRAPMQCIANTIDRIRKNAAAVARAPDRLSYTLIDFLLDNFEPAVDQISAEITDMEQNILSIKATHILEDVIELKNEVRSVRQIANPQREVIGRIARGEFKLVRPHLLPYYRDLLDRLKRTTDLTDMYRESLNNLLQVHLNLQQMQVNQVIKVLTVLATLSLPLVAVTSFYGMNFAMPELKWHYPHLWVLAITLFFTGMIYLFLKQKKWL